MWKVAFACALALSCAACVSPNIYKEPIAAFDKSVGDVKATVDHYATIRSEQILTDRTSLLVARKADLRFEDARCAFGRPADGCVIKVRGESEPLLPAAKIKSAELADALKGYSGALVTVVNATIAEDLGKGIDDLSGTIKKLGGHLGAGDGSTFASNIGPITALVKLIAVNIIEQQRREILRTAINAADPAVQGATRNLATLLHSQQVNAIDPLHNRVGMAALRYNVLGGELRPGRDTEPAQVQLIVERSVLLKGALEDNANLRKLLATDARKAVLSMGAAHAALKTAINDPDLSLEQLYAALKAFADNAKAAYEALQQLK